MSHVCIVDYFASQIPKVFLLAKTNKVMYSYNNLQLQVVFRFAYLAKTAFSNGPKNVKREESHWKIRETMLACQYTIKIAKKKNTV